MFVLKKYLYTYFLIQLIFSFFCFLPQSFAYEQDIYFYPANGDINFMLPEITYKNSAMYRGEASKQYLRHQTPYFPYILKPENAKEEISKSEEKNEEIIENETIEVENISNSENLNRIVIIIDDMGVNRKRTRKIAELQYPLTVSFLTYAPHLREQIEQSQNSGQEIMIHVPMEPNVMQNYTEQMLTTDMTDEEIIKILETMLQQVPQAVGINNHMGSKFTEDEHRMEVVMRALTDKGLIFVDSKTSAKTAGPKQAQLLGTKFYMRDVFLDNENDYNYILSQLQRVEKIAHETGLAIAIGHPKEQTYNALKDWLPDLKEKGLQLIPVSQIKVDSQTEK